VTGALWLLGSGLVCGILLAAVLCALDAYLRRLRR
jgi:hypothetical protein